MRNGEATLARALTSLLGQSFGSLEVIAVDDGSTDATSELLRSAAASDGRVRVARQEPLGIVAALEHARRLARGRWLARMDADDEADPDRLRAQWSLAASRDLALVGCQVRYAPREGLSEGARRYERWLNGLASHGDVERDLWVECPIAHPAFFMRADAVGSAGGYRDAGWPEDYDLLLRLWRRGGRFGNVPAPLLRWFDSPGRLSRTSARYSPEAFRRCKVHHLRRSLLRGRRGAVLWGAGPTGKAFSRTLSAAGVAILAFVEVNPRKIGRTIHDAPVIGASEAGAVEGALHLAAVGQPGGRAEVRRAMARSGLREGVDAIAVA